MFSDGQKQTARWTKDKFGKDLAFILADNPAIEPIKISPDAPQVGQTIEIVSYLHPQSKLRNFAARVTRSDGNATQHDAFIMQGDSGGIMLDASHRVVGVINYGIQPAGQVNNSYVYRGGGGESFADTKRFLARVRVKYGGRQIAATQPKPSQTPRDARIAEVCRPGYTRPGCRPQPTRPTQGQRGPIGPPGPRGPPGVGVVGQDGLQGPPGQDGQPGAAADCQAFADANPIRVELYDTNGQLIETTSVSLGGVLRLQLYERASDATN